MSTAVHTVGPVSATRMVQDVLADEDWATAPVGVGRRR